ncbi:MAG: hypothetical protein ABI718_08005 [Acidobacteriota bacterium]
MDHLDNPDELFEFARVSRADELPPPRAKTIDVALLDMNHNWTNLGHDSLVRDIGLITGGLRDRLLAADLTVRVISFDVRRGLVLPEGPKAGRYLLYVGSGGPGHLDPRFNDGLTFESQGVEESIDWEQPLFDLFEAIRRHDKAALIAVCHSFGLLCRWAKIAEAVLRGAEKDGKSSGVVLNYLTDDALDHPYFSQFAAELKDHRHCRVLDNRLFDLIPTDPNAMYGVQVIGRESKGEPEGGESVTMIEFQRDRGGVMPKIFGVNHHPEIIDRKNALFVLREKFDQGEVTEQWYEERSRSLTQELPGEDLGDLLRMTSFYTLIKPLRFHLERAIRERISNLAALPEESAPVANA